MKRAVCICGGPGRGSAAASLLAEAARGLEETGVNVETCFLAEKDVAPCSLCGGCTGAGTCARNDGLQEVSHSLLHADIVFIAGVGRWGGLDAHLRALFDRTATIGAENGGSAQVRKDSKTGYVIIANTSRSSAESLEAADAAERWFRWLGIRPAGKLRVEGAGAPNCGDGLGEALKAAYDAGRGFLEFGSSGRAPFGLAVAAPGDAGEIAAMNLMRTCEIGGTPGESPAKMERGIRRMLRRDYTGILAWVKGNIAGYLLYRPEYAENGDPGYRVIQLYIKPEYRYRGLEEAALRRIVDLCFRDVVSLSAVSSQASSVGKAFWERSACEPVRIAFTKPIPIFDDVDPLAIIGWEPRKARARLHRTLLKND